MDLQQRDGGYQTAGNDIGSDVYKCENYPTTLEMMQLSALLQDLVRLCSFTEIRLVLS
jgi:hypothetical protein